MANLISISISPAGVLIPEGDAQQFTATGAYSNGSTQDLTQSVSWSSDDVTVIAIDSNGLATGIAAGTANIQAQSGALVTNVAALVEAGIESIAVAPPSASMAVGDTLQFTATATFTDSHIEVITDEANWSSSDETVLTVGAYGLATAIGAGSCGVVVDVGSESASSAVTVSAPASTTPPITPPTIPPPCALLQKLFDQFILMMSGQATVAIETPQLGRVEFNRGNVGNIQALMNGLAQQCALCGGPLPYGFTYQRRRPISIQAWP